MDSFTIITALHKACTHLTPYPVLLKTVCFSHHSISLQHEYLLQCFISKPSISARLLERENNIHNERIKVNQKQC